MTSKNEKSQKKQPVSESEALFRGLFENSSDAIQILDNNIFVECNQATVEILRARDKNEVLSIHPSQFSPEFQPDGRPSGEKADEMIRTALEKGGHRFEWTYRRMDGEDFPVEVMLTPVTVGGKTIIYSSWRDIAKRKQMEEEILAEGQRSQTLLETMRVPMLISRLSDGIVLYANEAIAQVSQVNLDKLIGFKTGNFYANPDDRKIVLESLQQHGHINDFEVQFRRTDGSLYWALLSSRIVDYEGERCVLSMYIDITERKKAEQAVKEEQERLQNILESISVPIIISRLSDSEVLYANRALAEVGQIDLDTLIGGRTVDYFVNRAERDKVAESLSQVGHIEAFETQLRRGNGEIYWALLSAHVINYQGDVCVFTSYTDITGYREAEENIRQEKALSDAVINGLPGVFYLFESDGSMVRWNEEYEQVTGYNTEEMATRNALDAIPDEEKERTLAAIGSVFEKGQAEIEAHLQTREGELIPYHLIGRRLQIGDQLYVAGSGIDITERKQAEERSLTFQALIENAADAIAMTDLQGKISFANRAAYEFFGLDYEKQELIGRTSSFLMATQEQEHRAEVISQVMETGGSINDETTLSRIDGSKVDVLITVFPVLDASGQPAYMGAILHDITERKKLQAQVQEAFERRGYQVQVSTEISQQISQAAELGDLFERVVTLTKERLGYYHTQLLRYDPSQDAVVLTAGYGETGQKMFDAGHRMPMGSGLIGTAAASGETVMRSELAQDPDWEPNPLLPETKGEIAVPIKLGDEVLGVLDVQSSQAGALSDDDRLLLEGICGQIAIAMDQTRLRQEMEERLQEINNLYRAMSHEGWQSYRETAALPGGFMYDQIAVRPVEETGLAKGLFANAPMVLPGGEMLGELGLADDPDKPLSEDDKAFLEQVSEQVALALESARLSEQTQSALAQSEKMFNASSRLTQATDLQEVVAATINALNIPDIAHATLMTFDYNSAGEIERQTVVANWWSETSYETTPVGTQYSSEMIKSMPLTMSPTPIFFNDLLKDERLHGEARKLIEESTTRAIAALPLHTASGQIGVLTLEADVPHNFTPEEARLFESLAPQVATVLENRQQYEQAQRQAERESMLNAISQKIQSATSVEAVLQIAARELGHALGAPMTIAQLSMKDQK